MPANQPITCQSEVVITDNNTVDETAAVQATRRGAIGTCSVVLPYSCRFLTSAAQDTTQLSYQIAPGTIDIVKGNLTVTRASSQVIATFNGVPRSGAIENLSATI